MDAGIYERKTIQRGIKEDETVCFNGIIFSFVQRETRGPVILLESEENTNYHFEAHNKIMIQARIINYY